ncbi:MAG: SocA family protein [Acaryochloris sp. RU_4_1]|nr:SocA family protein [Acaryochloris sp. RU_4_1]
MTSVLDVAWYFVQKGNGDPSITQLKLQKLVYYAQGFYLGLYGKPLFLESIEAWEYGPVAPVLRNKHINLGAKPISLNDISCEKPIGDDEVRTHLERIWLCFGHYTAGKLVDMTHQESPWKETYIPFTNVRIGEQLMRHHFINRLGELESATGTTTCEPMSDIYLKGGQTVKVPESKAEAFLIANADSLEAKYIQTRGRRRQVAEPA